MKPNELKVTVSKEEAARLNGSLTIGIISPIMKIYQYAAFLSNIDSNDEKVGTDAGIICSVECRKNSRHQRRKGGKKV